MRVILASKSPRRRELMDMIGVDYEIVVSNKKDIKEIYCWEDGKLYGKPKDRQDAINMINELKNDKHQVFTSLAILVQKGNEYKEYIDCDIADVYICDMTDQEIEKWVSSGEADDKAGAYAIQTKFGVFVDKIDGNYYTVIGLPINKVYNVLKEYIDI